MLTWWEGRVSSTRGLGEYVMLDDSYREIARLPAGNGYSGDLHEFLITSRDTALVTVYGRVRGDLSSLGGAEDAAVLEGIVQELDVESGEVLFEWRSLEHVGSGEWYLGPPDDPEADFDYFHLNSIEVDHDDNLLISARNTWSVYKIDRETGEVMWRLGGKMSDFEMGPGTGLAYQHDARRQPDGTIMIFDNGAAPKVHDRSRGIVVELDLEAMKAILVREYTYPDETLLAGFLGNMQALEGGNVFVGWGSGPFLSEFGPAGELLFDAKLPSEYMSYRSYRLEWEGYPADRPAMVAERRSGGEITLYASWNEATEVAEWKVLAGAAPERLRSVATAPLEDFETSASVRTEEPYIAVRARDRSGRELGVSGAVELAR